MTLLSKADSQRVEAAIASVEARSATELVVAVLPRSGEYWQGRVLVAFAWALGTAFTVSHFWPSESVLLPLLLQVPAALLAYALFGLAPLWRLLIAAGQADTAVQERAFALFSERGLHRTRDRTGMLILLSELEHRVVILGDTAIHERVGAEGWQGYVATIVSSIRSGKVADGLLQVIGELDELHGQLLPVSADDSNELPNEIVRSRR